MPVDEEPLAEAVKDNTDALNENTDALNDPVAKAAALTVSLNENTTAVKTLTDRYRHVWVAIVLIVVALLLGGFAIKANYDQRVEACDRDNRARQANLDLWHPLLLETPLPTPLPPDASQEERDEYERRLAQRRRFEKTLTTGFAIHDC